MVMKTQFIRLLGILFLTSIISCEKSTEADLEALTMELESCKPDKKKLHVGMEYQGGIIFYLDETGKHGLIAAKENVGPAPWGCYGQYIPELDVYPMDSKTATKILLQNCKEPGIAARLCARYEVREKGKNGRIYKDWYMAGINELSMIMSALGRGSNMCSHGYWDPKIQLTSFQAIPMDPAKQSMVFSLTCGETADGKFYYAFFNGPLSKNKLVYARPIRDF
jgi:hypothetical protein